MRRAASAIAFVMLAGLNGVSAQAPATRDLSGTVVAPDGTPIRHARVVVVVEGTGATAETHTDAGGRFAVWLPADPGAYRIAVTADGFHAASRRGGGTDMRVVLSRSVVALAPLSVEGVAGIGGIAGASQVLDRTDLASLRPAAAHEIVRHAAGIHVMEEDALGLHLNIGVRGLPARRSTRVLLLEDGVPIHLGPYTDPSVHYQPPAETLARIEVLRGAGQVMHGPQTVGGVINFVRAAPPRDVAASVALRAGDRGRRTGHVTAGTGVGRHAVAMSFNRRQAEGPQRGARHDVDDVAGQVLLDLGGAGSLLLRAALYREDSFWGESGLTQSEFEADPYRNPSPADRFDLRRRSAQAIYQRTLAGTGRATTVLYGQAVERTSWRQANSSADRFGTDAYARSFGCADGARSMADCGFQGRPRYYRFAGLEQRLHYPLQEGRVLAALDGGARIHVERAERRQFLGDRPAEDGASLVRDNVLDAEAYAVFARISVGHGAWAVTPGLRLEHVAAGNRNRMSGAADRSRHSQWLPGVGATRGLGHGATLFAGVHRGFAPPRPGDVLSPQAGQGIVQVDPELSWNYEAGIRTRPMAGLELDVAAFRIDFRNQIVEGGQTGAGQRFVNAGRTDHQGLEVFARLDGVDAPRRIRPLASATYTLVHRANYASDVLSTVDGMTHLRGRRLPFAPRHLLNATGGLASTGGATIVLRISYTSEQYADDLNTRTPSADGQAGVIPGHAILGITANHPVGRGRGTLFASVDNLRNTVHITERLEGIMVGAPRRFTLGLEWSARAARPGSHAP
jgi:Fe(3+) dicitrate transport protein